MAFGSTRFGAASFGGSSEVEIIEKHPGFGSGDATSPTQGSGEAEVTSFGQGQSTTGDA